MKKFLFVAVLGASALGLGTGTASAWTFRDWWCNRHSPKVHCRQYNAFSPYCCDPLPKGCVHGGQPYNHGWDGHYANGHLLSGHGDGFVTGPDGSFEASTVLNGRTPASVEAAQDNGARGLLPSLRNLLNSNGGQ